MIRMNPPRLDHLRRLTDSKGLIHAAIGEMPDRFGGYWAIDNADALRLCAQVSGAVQGDRVFPLAKTYFDFLSRGKREDGRIFHACDAHGAWDNGGDDGLVQARLARALAAVIVSELPIAMRLQAASWWRELLPHADDVASPVAAGQWLAAIGMLGAADPGKDLARADRLARRLVEDFYAQTRDEKWVWFEERWTPGSACVPEGLWYASQMLRESRYGSVAESTTRFLIAALFEDDIFAPPGTRGGWAHGIQKGRFDQQPADASTMIDLLCTAERISGQPEYGEYAERAARWFGGDNLCGLTLVDEATGGCSDGLAANGPRGDQGGTAVVHYLLSEASRAARAAILAEPPVYMVPIGG